MNPTSALLIVSGIALLGSSCLIVHALRQREGKPDSFWTRTETRATASALGLLVLFVAGVGLLARGVFA
ncbi:MAG: hypothetical protein KJ025_06865 [Burkholderiales bacterium]|nr:hypothetical protein [Burkholderiales bacterium]